MAAFVYLFLSTCAIVFVMFAAASADGSRFELHRGMRDTYCSDHATGKGVTASRLSCARLCLGGCTGFFYNSMSKMCTDVKIVSVPQSGCVQENGSDYYMQIGCYAGATYDYAGTWSRTVSGRECQHWDKQSPHQQYHYQGIFPPGETYVTTVNYCRDMDYDGYSGFLWCYTTDPDMRWDSCEIPSC